MIPWGLRVPITETNFCSSVLLNCRKLPYAVDLATGLDASLSFSSTSRRSFLGIDHQVVFLFHQCISFYNKSKIIGLYYPTDATPQSPQKRTLFVERHTPRKLGNGRTYHRDGLITSLHEGLFCYCCGDLSRKHCFSFNMHTVYFPLVKQKTKNASLSRSFL